MDNPETLATLDTQDIGQRQTKQQQKNRKQKDEQHGPHQKPGVNSDARE